MIKKVLLRVANYLYRSSVYINNLLINENLVIEPYILRHNPTVGAVKIIHINGNFIVGGTSQLIVDIIERTSECYNHEIIVPDFPEPLPYQPVTIHKYSIYELTELREFMQQVQPAFVHIHYWVRYASRHGDIALWYGAVFAICEELNIKVIQNINVPTQPYSSAAVVRNVFVSKFVLENFNNTSVAASVIYPGSNFSHFKNERVELLPGNSIGMVYRLDRDKLNAESIEVFIEVVKQKPDVLCYIVGGGYYLDLYKQRVAEEGLEANFVFPGIVSYQSLPDYYKQISIFVAPVHDESFGQVTPFAMSMGLCVAGYDTGAIREILGSGDTLAPHGGVGKLASIIIDLVDNPQKRAAIGSRNRERAHQNFSVETMISEYRALYKLYA